MDGEYHGQTTVDKVDKLIDKYASTPSET
ncbi:MAG: hypothetical protein ABIL05_02305 [candidate division WOR-3 bacterium]